MFILLLFLFPLIPNCHSQSYDVIIKGEWGYNVINGPSTWHYNHPECGGSSQSPIEIITRAVEEDTSEDKITFNNYNLARNCSLLNNGHTISFQYTGVSEDVPSISGGHLKNEEYTFQQSHWHWGSTSSTGSEHHIDGLKDPMEIHHVHMNTKYPNLTEAFKHSDGIAVLAFLYEISDINNKNLTQIVSTLDDINNHPRASNETENVYIEIPEPMSAAQLMVVNMFEEDYFHYQGSLTTPDCYESVSWTVFSARISVSEAQLEVFRRVKTLKGDNLSNNIRPVQEVNGRAIKRVRSNGNMGFGSVQMFLFCLFLSF